MVFGTQEVARRYRAGCRVPRVDQAGPLRGEARRQQLVQRNRDLVGVCDVTVAIGECEPARFQIILQRTHRIGGGQVDMRKDIQRLADC